MQRIVLDTNVLVSGLISAFNPPGRIVDGLRAGLLQLCIDDRIMTEYRDVLGRPELERWIHPADRSAIIDHIRTSAHKVDTFLPVEGLPDPDDAPFAEVAAIAQVPLITGNERHFPRAIIGDVVVLSPSEFIESLSQTDNP